MVSRFKKGSVLASIEVPGAEQMEPVKVKVTEIFKSGYQLLVLPEADGLAEVIVELAEVHDSFRLVQAPSETSHGAEISDGDGLARLRYAGGHGG